MKQILFIALILIAGQAEAGMRTCKKRFAAIRSDPSTGITAKLTGSHITLVYEGAKPTEKQEDLIEELQDCFAQDGETGFYLYSKATKKYQFCRFLPERNTFRWSCEERLP